MKHIELMRRFGKTNTKDNAELQFNYNSALLFVKAENERGK